MNQRRGTIRVLVYSHDTYGLGHLRRSLLIAEGLASAPDFGSTLIATGSPRAQAFSLPPRTDTLKLPAVVKTTAGEYRARSLGLALREMIRIRTETLCAVARAFRPDLLLVDHSPAGMQGELHSVFREVCGWARRPKLILGLRDIIDEPDRVRREWDRLGAMDLLDDVYDRVLIYGDAAVRTTAEELGLPARLPGRVIPVGYLGRRIERAPDPSDPYILVTAGGGGDGHPLLRAYLAYLESLPPSIHFRSVLVSGPFLSDRRQREIAARAQTIGRAVEVTPFTDRFEELLGGATGVISMAGYNTVVEILSAGVPALLVPRENPRLEQRLRAERLARVADVEVCLADRLEPGRIGSFVARVFADGGPKPHPVDLGGVQRTALELSRILRTGDRLGVEGGRRRRAAIA